MINKKVLWPILRWNDGNIKYPQTLFLNLPSLVYYLPLSSKIAVQKDVIEPAALFYNCAQTAEPIPMFVSPKYKIFLIGYH